MDTMHAPPEVVGIKAEPCSVCGGERLQLLVASFDSKASKPVVTWDAARPVTERELARKVPLMAHRADERALGAPLSIIICKNCDVMRWLTKPATEVTA